MSKASDTRKRNALLAELRDQATLESAAARDVLLGQLDHILAMQDAWRRKLEAGKLPPSEMARAYSQSTGQVQRILRSLGITSAKGVKAKKRPSKLSFVKGGNNSG